MARSRSVSRDGWWPMLFVLPTMAGVAVFYLYPLVRSAYLSLTSTGAFGGSTFKGLGNYVALLSSPELPRAFLNTMLFTGIVLLGIPLAVIFAALLNRPGLKGALFFRTLFFLPYVAMPTAISMVWRLIFNGEYGVVNEVLEVVGIQGPSWIATPGFAICAVAVVGLWMSIGFNMIILSAGLKGIPQEYYEATAIDGANRWQQFKSITVPLLTPSIFFLTIIQTIGGLQLFDLLFAMLGPTNPIMPKQQSIVMMFYQAAFENNDTGSASAIAMLVLVVIGVLTGIQFWAQRKWVNYAD